MTRDHAVIEELLAIRSLGGLDGDDVERLERELAVARRLRGVPPPGTASTTRPPAAWRSRSIPTPVDMEQANEILRRATHPATQDAAPAPVAAPIDELEARRARRGRSWPALVAAAVAIILVVSAVALFGPERSTGVQASTDQTGGRASPATRGSSRWRTSPGKPGALLVGSGFEDPGADKVYAIWMLQGTTPVSGGCVRPHDGSIVVFVDADLAGTDQMAVTVEPASCPSAPTTTPVLVSDPLVA